MKVFLGAVFFAVLMAVTPMLSQAAMGGYGMGGQGMNDGMFQQAFDDYNQQNVNLRIGLHEDGTWEILK